MVNPQTYIEEQLKRLSQKSDISVNFKNDDERAAYISKAILSKKFRKYAVDEELLTHLQSAIKISFAKKEPIKFVMPFGGYKLWRFEEAPEVDWAELFSLMFYAAWLKPVAESYEPGVWFDFSSDDVIVERLNNTPKADTKAYELTFNSTISFLEKYVPSNLKFTFTSVGSRYAEEEFDTELEQKIQEFMNRNNGLLPVLTADEIAVIDLNSRPTKEQIADPLWHAKNKVMHDCYMGMSKRRPYTRTEDKIVVFTKVLPKGVAIGTTKTSIAKFWAGVGALKARESGYIETVLTPEQLHAVSVKWEPIHLDGLEGKNFKKIRIIKS